jgi:hypothetical protein
VCSSDLNKKLTHRFPQRTGRYSGTGGLQEKKQDRIFEAYHLSQNGNFPEISPGWSVQRP